ncbi:MAG: hypothetical protein RI894_736, partial [Bacteroidota bacterium]
APVLASAIRFKYAVVGASVAALLIAGFAFATLGGEFIPTLQEGDFNFDFILPQGASLSQTVKTSMQAARMLRQFPEVKMVVGKTGTSEIPMDVMPTEGTDMIIILKDKSDWTTTDDYNHLGELMAEKLRNIPGVFVEQSQPIQMRFNDLMTGVTQDVAVKIFGENLDSLALLADKVAATIQTIDGAGEPKIRRVTGLPQIAVQYDRSRLAQYGISVKTMNQVVTTAFAGQKAGIVFENERRFDLVMRLDSAYRNSISDVSDLFVPLPNGGQIPLSQVATIGFKDGPAEIGREAGKRCIVIGFNLKGRDVQSVVNDMQAKLNKQIKLPLGYYFTYGGSFENLQKATERLLIALPIALLLIFILLYFTFHSAKQAALIFTAIPMSAIGGVFALLLRGMPFSISAGVGFIALFGVAVLNGIVLIGTFNDLEEEGFDDIIQRVKEGTKIRLRPVLMTATVASLGFLPMALSHGAGAEVQKPLATVVIGGLLSATFLTLVVLPLLYLIFTKKSTERHLLSIKNAPLVTSIFVLFAFFSPNLFSSNFLSSNLFAQKHITIEEAVAIGLQQNLYLRVNDAEIAKANAHINTAAALPKTGVFIENEDLRPSDPEGILKAGLSQTLDFPTVYPAKRQLAIQQAKQVSLNKGISEIRLRRTIHLVYYDLWYLYDKKKLFTRLDTLYSKLADAADLRTKTGEATGLERIAAAAKSSEQKAALRQVEKDIAIGEQALMQLLNSTERIAPSDKSLEKIVLDLPATVSASHPQLAFQQQNIAIAQAEKHLQNQQNLPDFSGRIFSQRAYGKPNPYSGFSLTIGIPLFAANAEKQNVAKLEIALQEKLFAQQAQALAAAQIEANNRTIQAQIALEYYEKTGLPQAHDIIAAATLAYKSGEISYATLSLYLSQATDIQQNYLNSLARYNQAATEQTFLAISW